MLAVEQDVQYGRELCQREHLFLHPREPEFQTAQGGTPLGMYG